jgi:hypothetical protein
MHKLYLIAALALTLASCEALTKPTSLIGTYKYVGKIPPGVILMSKKLEFTKTKVVMDMDITMDYTIEDNYVYIGPPEGQVRFKVVSKDTLRNDGTYGFEGTYAKVSQ